MANETVVKGASGGGVGIGIVCFGILLVLKILGKIAMPWWLVITSFIWAPIGAIIAIIVLILVGIGIGMLFIITFAQIADAINKRKRRKQV